MAWLPTRSTYNGLPKHMYNIDQNVQVYAISGAALHAIQRTHSYSCQHSCYLVIIVINNHKPNTYFLQSYMVYNMYLIYKQVIFYRNIKENQYNNETFFLNLVFINCVVLKYVQNTFLNNIPIYHCYFYRPISRFPRHNKIAPILIILRT